MRTRTRPLTAAAVTAALLFAGCGDDDDEPATPTNGATGATGASGAALSDAEFIAAADDICQAGDEEIDGAAQTVFGDGQPSDAEAVEFAAETVVPSFQEQHDAIASLSVPEGDEDTIDELLAALQRGIDGLEADPSTIGQADDLPDFEEARRLATEYGFEVCGSD